MISSIDTVCFEGIHAIPILVQVQVAGGSLPSFSIVGLPDKAVNESRERIRSAFYTLGIALPPKRITINLSPANIQKEGSHYDLPLALGLMMALDLLPKDLQAVALGELGLDGSLKPVRGILSAALLASSLRKILICPQQSGSEGAWAGDIEILSPSHLLSLVNHFKGLSLLSMPEKSMEQLEEIHGDMSDVRGQEIAKRALTVAATGQHSIILVGPQGTGKSMLAQRIPSIIPPLSPEEALEVTMIHSMAHLLKGGKLLRTRPFRTPHHSISPAALIGGGIKGLPGEVSLAHRGFLFCDELSLFSSHALEALRQSLESKEAVISRANYRVVYPANFHFIGAMNPCRCGYLGQKERECTKAPFCGTFYQQKLSGPLRDRMDMIIEVPPPSMATLSHASSEPESKKLYAYVERGKEMQKKLGFDGFPSSHHLENEIKKNQESYLLLLKATEKWGFSIRGYYRLIRVARTIACLEGQEVIQRSHILEALSYRVKE